MATVSLRPGDTLNVVWPAVYQTPLGSREVESSFSFSYDELVSRLRTKGRGDRSRRSGTEGARFSRIIALSTNAIHKGKWSTGADIDRDQVFERMCLHYGELDRSEYVNVTANARRSLLKLHRNSSMLSSQQRKELRKIMDILNVRYS